MRGKPELRRDLTHCGLLQLALPELRPAHGWISRPVFLVGDADRIDVVFASDIDREDLSQRRHAGGPQPAVERPATGCRAVLPEDSKAQEQIMLQRPLIGKHPEHARSDLRYTLRAGGAALGMHASSRPSPSRRRDIAAAKANANATSVDGREWRSAIWRCVTGRP